MSLRVLVTGAGGFLGRPLCAALAARGDTVVPLTRAEADVADLGALLAHARPAEAVIHLAFPTDHARRQADPLGALHEAVAGAAAAAALAARAGARHALLASSGKVYGRPARLPVPEDAPVAPTTWLGHLKRAQEQVLAAAAGPGGFGLSLLRVFNVYGPGQPAGFLFPTLLAEPPLVLGELAHRRDWLHMDDVVAAFLAALDAPPAPGVVRPVNVASGVSHSVAEILDLLAGLRGARPEVEVDPARLRPDEAADERGAADWLRGRGWRPRVELPEGLRRLLVAGGQGA